MDAVVLRTDNALTLDVNTAALTTISPEVEAIRA